LLISSLKDSIPLRSLAPFPQHFAEPRRQVPIGGHPVLSAHPQRFAPLVTQGVPFGKQGVTLANGGVSLGNDDGERVDGEQENQG
jgi:hypothetical protein